MLDVNSGAVHVVDDIVYDVIPYLEQDGETPASIRDSLAGKYPEEEIKAAMDECQELKRADFFSQKTVTVRPLRTLRNVLPW